MKPTSSTVDHRIFQERLESYGCSEVIRLDEPLSEPAQLGYLDLLPKTGTAARSVAVAAVAEHQGTALLYLMDGDFAAGGGDAIQIAKTQRLLANRSDPAWLGVVRPGSLDIYPIGFHERVATAPVTTVQQSDAAACLFFQSLVHGTFSENGRLNGSDYVFKKIFGLLTQTTDAFVPKDGKGKLEPLHVLSMAGRALFFRFLIDRRIVLEGEIQEICPQASGLKDTFSDAEKAAHTSAWLDKTFNGDFLQLVDESIPRDDEDARRAAYLSFYQDTEKLVGRSIFEHLHAILRGWPAQGGAIQQELDWGDFDFAHVPVGVLSQVYESFSHRANPDEAKTNSVHYTPRSVAGLMIEQSFAALEDKAKIRVLDPSCGAGIFLVLAFRRLVSERWQHDEQRPNTAVIQEILYRQLRGYDVSEPALRLAALALYITAIEVNGSPRPPKNLKFPKNLRDVVLFRFGDGTPTGFTIGSLAVDAPLDQSDHFDLVIGNPPWTRLREPKRNSDEEDEEDRRPTTGTAKLNSEFTAIGRRVLNGRGMTGLAKKYQNPDNNPDVPFLWRAMEWAKQDGIIALAMPARLYGRIAGKGFQAWKAVLRSVEVTGLINGADLRKTPVWEDIDMPFCVLFARNSLPKLNHRFYYASPLYEPDLNGWARFRIDEDATQPISVDRVEQQPWLLKTLSLGTWLDVEVVETLLKAFPGTLGSYWKSWNSTMSKTGKGYTLSRDLKQKQVPFLGGLKDFHPPESGFAIDFEGLKTFRENHFKDTVYSTKGEPLYQPPLVIIPKAPGDEPLKAKAFISLRQPLAFSQSSYGYSCEGHAEPETLISLIYLLAHSTLFRYFALMVSVSQGADHMIFTKRDFDALPFPEIASLKEVQKTRIRELRRRIESESPGALDNANSFLFELYGLNDKSVQVIEDTLYSSIPYRKAGRDALERTRHKTRGDFISELQGALEPYFDVCGEHCSVREAAFQPNGWSEPWYFLAVSRDSDSVPADANLLREAMKIANHHGSSRIVVQTSNRRGLLLGLLNRRRWWTRTRAFLCSQHIIRHHLGAFGLPEEI